MKTTILLVTLLSIYQNAADSGKATMYGGNLDGNACGMDGTADAFSNTHFVAIGSTNFDDGYGCGKCYQITCIGPYGDNPSCSCSGTITVQAIDQCPECSDSHFDLNDDALAALTGGSSDMAGLCGVVEIEYSRVDCSAITSNFYIENKSGTSQHWYGFHLNDVNDDGGIKSIQLLKNGDTVATCDKSNGPSFWICNGGGAITDESNLPLDIKITSDEGKSVTASGCITSFTGGQVMKCNTNLGGGSSSGSSDTTTTTTTTTSSGSSGSSDGTIKIKQNTNVNEYWYAIEFPNGFDSSITNIEMRDSTHTSWQSGTKVNWDGTIAYQWGHKDWGSDATFSGSQHFRVTTDDGMQATWNVFTGLSAESTADLNMPGSAYTEEDGDDTSSFPIAAIVAVVLLVCIITGVGAYCLIKRRKQKAAVSFEDKNSKGDTDDSDARPRQDGVDTKSDETAGYDMSPIDTTDV